MDRCPGCGRDGELIRTDHQLAKYREMGEDITHYYDVCRLVDLVIFHKRSNLFERVKSKLYQ